MIHLLMAVLMAILAYLVKYRKWSFLIAGYNTSSKKEKDKYDTHSLCRGVGNFLFIITGIMLIGAIGEFLELDWLLYSTWFVFGLIGLGFIIYANTGGRFKN